jgi:hypothetical protein
MANKPKPFTLEYFREMGRKGGKKRFAGMSQKELKNHQRKAGQARGKQRKEEKGK